MTFIMNFLKTLFKTRYRIVRDNRLGYELQHRPWWSPIYFMPYVNTCRTVEEAEEKVQRLKNKVVKYVT